MSCVGIGEEHETASSANRPKYDILQFGSQRTWWNMKRTAAFCESQRLSANAWGFCAAWVSCNKYYFKNYSTSPHMTSFSCLILGIGQYVVVFDLCHRGIWRLHLLCIGQALLCCQVLPRTDDLSQMTRKKATQEASEEQWSNIGRYNL